MFSGLYSYLFVGGVCICWAWGKWHCSTKYIYISIGNSLHKQHRGYSSYSFARWLFFQGTFKNGCAVAPCGMCESPCIRIRKMTRFDICRRKVRLPLFLLLPLLPCYLIIITTADIKPLQRSTTARFVKSKKRDSIYWIWNRKWKVSLIPMSRRLLSSWVLFMAK